MPTYEYACQSCGHAFDHYQSMTSAKLTDCPECHQSALKRLIGRGGALIFKGNGFYCTDYKETKQESAQEKGDSPATEKKIEKAKEAAKDAKASSSSSSTSTTPSAGSTS